MFRDISMAFCFGSHPAVAAFMLAFRFANLFRRLCGEGALPASFIPHFESLRAQSPEKSIQFFRDLFFSLVSFLILLIFLMEVALFYLLKLELMSPENAEIINLSRLMLPALLFISLFGLTSAFLQCEKKFFLSGVAPVAFNFVWVGAVWLLRGLEIQRAMEGLAISVILAFGMQWLMTMKGNWWILFQKTRVSLFSQEMRQMVKPLFLSILGVGAVQINSLFDGLFARAASLEGPAYLWYAIRLEQLPLALFGIALSSALLPPLSRAIQAGEWDRYQELLSYGLKRSFIFMMPCTCALFVLGGTGVNLLYGRGDFSEQATLQTIICLWGYGIGLVPSVFVLLLAPSFYAQKDYKTPTLAASYSVIMNIALNALFIFVFRWGVFSVALATSLSSFFNVAWLCKKRGFLINKSLLFTFVKVVIISLLSGGMTLFLGYFFHDPTWVILQGKQLVLTRNIGEQLIQFGLLSLFFGFSFLMIGHLGGIGILKKQKMD